MKFASNLDHIYHGPAIRLDGMNRLPNTALEFETISGAFHIIPINRCGLPGVILSNGESPPAFWLVAPLDCGRLEAA